LVEFCCKEFTKKNKEDLTDARALRRLRTACEKAKRNLSTMTSTQITVDSLFKGIDFDFTITRAKFEQLNGDLFEKCFGPVKQVLDDAKVKKSEIEEIVLVGGSTRIPKIQDTLVSFFDGKKLNMTINPDEAVAYGAAIQAAVLTGKATNVLLIDVTPLSLGIETQGGVMAKLIPRNTTIPCKKSEIFTTTHDNQTEVDTVVFEGERVMTRDNNKLGEFLLSGITPLPKGKAQIEVTFELDANGIMNVTAQDTMTGKKNNIIIKNEAGRLSDEEIEKMLKDAEKMKSEDQDNIKKIDAKNELEAYLFQLSNALGQMKISKNNKELVGKVLEQTLMWIDSESEGASYADVLKKKKGVEQIVVPILTGSSK